MAMYYYASKISAIACGTRCKQTVLQKSRGQRDRDKCDDTFCTYHDDGGCGGGVDDVDEGNNTRTAVSEMNVNGIELDFHNLEVSTSKTTRRTFSDIGIGSANCDSEIVIYDIPKNSFMRSQSDVNYESSVLGSGGIMYINGKIVSGPLESLTDVLVPKNINDLDKDFIFSFLLCSRLFIRPHELLGKLLSMVPDSESLELLVALLAEWTNKFPYDFRDERIMSHVKHIVARCSNTGLEGLVSEMLSALLKRLTDLERHEEDLRACQQSGDKANTIDCPTASQYAQILCRLERRLAKHIGPEEFLQCSKNVLLDKQSKKWDQPSTSSGPPGAQDPKKTCNLETYLDWSARLRLFVCNEILQCHCVRERSRIVELWSGVAQYCLLVGNYNSATAILETLESPPIARLKITWSKLSMTCQQLDCMQRHAEGYGNLWNKQAIVLNENHHYQQHRHQHHHPPHNHHHHHQAQQPQQQQQQQKTDLTLSTDLVILSSSSSLSTATTPKSTTTATTILTTAAEAVDAAATTTTTTTNGLVVTNAAPSGMGRTTTKPNDWVVIPVFADIVKLAISGRDDCMQRLPNGHINVTAFDRMAAIVGAFTRHMTEVKSPTTGATTSGMDEATTTSSSSSTSSSQAYGEYESFCRHMQKTTTLNESELMMASFDCEKANNAEKLMYDLN